MNIGQYSTRRESFRLSGQLEQRGSKSGMPTSGLFLFGGLFVAVGCMIILVGLKVIPVNPKSVHAPYWVLTVVGAVFAFGGTSVWGMAWRQWAAGRHVREAASLFPGEEALQDYKWDPRGHSPSRWAPVVKSVTGMVFLAAFLSMFNWWAFVHGGPLLLKIIVGLFNLLLLFVVWQTCVRFGRAFKFGDSRVHYLQFPYRLAGPVVIRWQAAHGITRAEKGSFTLRCVDEYFEVRGAGKNRSKQLVHEQIWSGTWEFNEPRFFNLSEQIDLTFEIPADLPATRLHSDRPVFWELEVKLELPGLDFEQVYPIPIYK